MTQTTLAMKLNTQVIRLVEAIVSRGTAYPDSAFYGYEELPWLKDLEGHFEAIEEEGTKVFRKYTDLINLGDLSEQQSEIDASEGWKVFFLSGYGISSQSAQKLCPKTLSALQTVPNISSAIFSILAPGKEIALHRGMYKGLGRAHLPIKVPKANEDCWIEVDKQRRPWVKGEAFGFEDAFLHEVQNNTAEFRIILLITFERPMKPVFSFLNRAFLSVVKRTKYVRETKLRYERWERARLSDTY